MTARDANLLAIEQVAEKLGDLRDRVVFVGGSTAALFITSPIVHDVRATKDVDLVVGVARTADYYAFADELRAKGFQEDSREGAPMCRWVVAAVMVDIVPARADVFGPTNRWYASAVQRATTHLAGRHKIKVIHPVDFIATKLEAFAGRGGGDFMASHDLEDVIAVIDGRPEIVDELHAHADPDVIAFIASTLGAFLRNEAFVDAIPGFLHPDTASQARVPQLLRRLEAMAKRG